MFLAFDDGKCPICGVTGNEGDTGTQECPKCGAKFDDIGILIASNKKFNLDWN